METVMKLIWCSDIHLNFLKSENRVEFYEKLRESEGDVVLITGDIAESHNIATILEEMQQHIEKNIYFVAGNHDYYGSSLKKMRKQFLSYKFAQYLPNNIIYLNSTTVLVGEDGWGDGRNGDFEGSQRGFQAFTMSDWIYIDELFKAYSKGSEKLLKALQKVADEDAYRLARSVSETLKDKNVKRVILASHVPPFEEACLDAGRKSTSYGLCFFSSKILGETIIPLTEKYPEVDFLWLSGHTHSRCTVQKRHNLTVRVAQSEYYHPQIEDIISV